MAAGTFFVANIRGFVRFCELAGLGEILTRSVGNLEVSFIDRGAVLLKGIDEPVRVVQVSPRTAGNRVLWPALRS
jgi:hypothetical protein